jgi:hypothetical protein
MLKLQQVTTFALMIFTIFLITSCSGLQETKNKKANVYNNYIIQKKLESIKHISAFRFHGWNSLDNQYLIISTQFKKPYLISLNSFCLDLKFSYALIINNKGNRLQERFDSISVSNEPKIKCLIKHIYPITREQAKELATL